MEFLNNKIIIAITGPSGVGKTTLGENLVKNHNLTIPTHCTTRHPRSDDQEGFYRYLSHEEFKFLNDSDCFFIVSGDGPEVKKEYGNFYGILINDCENAIRYSDGIILFVSYKDIEYLYLLRNRGFDVKIVNLSFTEIAKNVKIRLTDNPNRNHSERDIESRIYWAIKDTEDFKEIVQRCATTTAYTDLLNIEKTYEKICSDLNLTKKQNNPKLILKKEKKECTNGNMGFIR